LVFHFFKTISVTCLWSQVEVSSNILENDDKFNFIIDAKIYIFFFFCVDECGSCSVTVEYRILYCLLNAVYGIIENTIECDFTKTSVHDILKMLLINDNYII
jgi:hypothetical protein